MNNYLVLYNPHAQTERGLESAKKIEPLVDGSCTYRDMTEPGFSLFDVLRDTDPEVKIVVTGGDGTLNRLLNSLPDLRLQRELYFFPGGSGNDFIRDLKLPLDTPPILLNPYIADLPTVKVGEKTYRFFNGVGVGLDGFCCVEKDRLKEKGIEKSYTGIALKGVLGAYKPCDAEVTVDGVTRKYKKLWMAPTMFGSCLGGGVLAAPQQDRNAPSHEMTSVVVHNANRLQVLFMFPLFCKGKGHLFPKHVDIRTGYEIRLKLSVPAAVQIDGEAIDGMTECEATSSRPEKSRFGGAGTGSGRFFKEM